MLFWVFQQICKYKSFFKKVSQIENLKALLSKNFSLFSCFKKCCLLNYFADERNAPRIS